MGRGGDLTDQEGSFVLSKVMQNWNSELRQIKAGGRKKILQACIKGGVLCVPELVFLLIHRWT